MSYHHQNDEAYDHLDSFEKGRHKPEPAPAIDFEAYFAEMRKKYPPQEVSPTGKWREPIGGYKRPRYIANE